MSYSIHRLIYFERFHRYSPGPSLGLVRNAALALAYVLARDYRDIVDARSDAFYPAHSNGRRFPVAIVGYGFPFDFGTSRSAKFHGREIFCARALIQV